MIATTANHTKSTLLTNERTGNSAVILLVEDEPTVREVTRQVLEHAGYEVLDAASPEEALNSAGIYDGRIDLLLTDVVMPGMDGAELAQRLQSKMPQLITVFMSGYAENEVVRRMRKTSVIHIQKPFTVNGLLTRITEALRIKSAAVGHSV